jgi:hypothetical protein
MKKSLLFNRYIIASVTIFFINLTLNGCYTLRESTVQNEQSIKIYKIITTDDDTVSFNKSKLGYAQLVNDKIISIKKDSEQDVFPISNIKSYYTEEFDTEKTILTVVGSAAFLILIWIGMVLIGMDGRGFGG